MEDGSIGYDRLQLIRTAGSRIAEVGRTSQGVPVPRYHGWTVADLIAHTGRVHRRTTQVVANRLTERPQPEAAPDSGLVEWFETGVEDLVSILQATEPTISCWGYGPEPTVAFWLRRMALETEVHRWDAESAVGVAADFAPAVAADGIDEVRVMWLPWTKPEGPNPPGPIAQFDPTDVEGTWTLSATEDGYELVTGAHDAPCHVAGPASDIYLAILGRLHGPLEERGDIAALARWRDVVQSMGDARR